MSAMTVRNITNEILSRIYREGASSTQRVPRSVLRSLLNISLGRFPQTFKQSVFSLSFNLGAILAGVLLAIYFGIFSLAPWTLAVYPGILSMRGVIGGLFSGRLSTGLHIGTVRVGFTKNTRNFYTLWRATIVLTLVSSVMLGTVASLFGMFFWGINFLDSTAILGVVIATMALSLVLISPITVAVSVLSFRRGLDPDVTVYPVISTVADIVVTACYILVLNAFFSLSFTGYYLIGVFNFIFLCLVLYILSRDVREEEFVKTIKESFLTIALVALIVNVTGSFLARITEVVGSRPEIYIVYPALIDTIGSVGSIVGSTATTKLVLGTLMSSFSSVKQHLNEIGGAWAASLVMFTLYSVISCVTQGMSVLKFSRFMVLLFVTNILAALSMVIIAYAVGILTYRKGWDPDNFVIPIESSLADTITTIALLAALNVIGL
ncbi:MAG: magnesium transporter [Candidatus Bathyarchaeota archaeon]|nr:MAG: magnesium transporter [Candidatus Bathyarchaeota archaeon]